MSARVYNYLIFKNTFLSKTYIKYVDLSRKREIYFSDSFEDSYNKIL